MNRGNFFRRGFIALLGVIFALNATVAHAEIYTGEGSYVMSEGENLGVAKERAKADAMRNATEKAGVYVKSYSRSKNFELEEDVIETMTANIIKLVENPHFYPLETVDNLEGVLIRVTVKVQIDDSDINRWLNKDDNEKSNLVSQMEALRKANEEQARQIAELKRQLANNPQDTERITKEFAAEDKIFLSNQKLDEAAKFYYKGDYNGAIRIYDEALSLNPNNALAYYGSGLAYAQGLKQYERAIQDYDKAIELNPNYAVAYTSRGTSYALLGQKERAIQDFDKAIELNPKHAGAYNNRGLTYRNLGQNELAIKDFNKAIELNPKYDKAYNHRGYTYQILGQYELAIKDYNKAIELNPNYALAYTNRGSSYGILGKYEQAIQDFNKAIELNPNNSLAYKIRGLCYQQLGDEAKAQADLDKEKELKSKNGRH